MFELKYLNSQARCETAVTAALLLISVFGLNETFACVYLHKIETFSGGSRGSQVSHATYV